METRTFVATTVHGSRRGKELGVPTINCNMQDVPHDLPDGIYACFIRIDETQYKGALHLGPRPVFKDIPSCEVHILDEVIDTLPDRVTIELVEYLRPVEDFANVDDLKAQMKDDIDRTRDILSAA